MLKSETFESGSDSDIADGDGYTADQGSDFAMSEEVGSADGCLKLKLADAKLESEFRDYARRSIVGQGSAVRSRSWDGKTMKASEGQIELQSRVQRSNKELLGHFFKYYVTQVMEKSATLNQSYFKKLKAEYSKLQSGQKIRFHELK